MGDGISYHASFECETTEEALTLMKAVFGINERFGIPNGGGENEPSRALVATVGGERGLGVDITSESKGAFKALSEELAAVGGMGHLAAVAYDATEVRTLTGWEQSKQAPDVRIPVAGFKSLRIEDFLDEAGAHNDYELKVKLPTEDLAKALCYDLSDRSDREELWLGESQNHRDLTVFGSENHAPLVDVFHVLENGEVGLSCKITEGYFEDGTLIIIADDVSPFADVPVAFAERVPASEISPLLAVSSDTEKMSLRRLVDECGDARDGRYAVFSVWCKDGLTEGILESGMKTQCMRAEYKMGQMETWYHKFEMEDHFQSYYGEWTPAFWKETAETLGRISGVCGSDAIQVRIEEADWIDVINRSLEEQAYAFYLEHTEIDFPGAQCDAVRVKLSGGFGNGIIPKSALEELDLNRAVEYLEGLVKEYGGFVFDRDRVVNQEVRLEDSREKLCSKSGRLNMYDHDFSRYRVIFKDLDPFEADMIRSAVDDCNLWKAEGQPWAPGSVMHVVESSANGRMVTVASAGPEVAAILGKELAFRGLDCVVSDAYPLFTAEDELVLEAVPRPDVCVEMSGADYQTKLGEPGPQTGEPRFESFMEAVKREQAEAQKQQPAAPQRKNGVERNRGMDVEM